MKTTQARDSSHALAIEADRMKARLDFVQEIVEQEKRKKEKRESQGGGDAIWRSAAASSGKKPLTRNYLENVLNSSTSKSKKNNSEQSRRKPSIASRKPSDSELTAGGWTDVAKAVSNADELDELLMKNRVTAEQVRGRVAAVAVAGAVTSSINENNHYNDEKHCDAKNDVFYLLKKMSLEKYWPNFKEHGFDSMDSLKLMTSQHMKVLALPLGHQLKLKNAIQQQHLLVDTNGDDRHEDGGGAIATSLSPSNNTRNSKNDHLGSGNFDEARNAEEFKKAVAEWRGNTANTIDNKEEQRRTVSTNVTEKDDACGQDDEEDEEDAATFWGKVGGGENTLWTFQAEDVDENENGEIPEDTVIKMQQRKGANSNNSREEGTRELRNVSIARPSIKRSESVNVGTETSENGTSAGNATEKRSCYVCYKLFFTTENEKPLCSDSCRQRHAANELEKQKRTEAVQRRAALLQQSVRELADKSSQSVPLAT